MSALDNARRETTLFGLDCRTTEWTRGRTPAEDSLENIIDGPSERAERNTKRAERTGWSSICHAALASSAENYAGITVNDGRRQQPGHAAPDRDGRLSGPIRPSMVAACASKLTDRIINRPYN